jgi:DNA end-binding protein Ku
MATRAYWSGRIRLSLVSIPVQVLAATKSAAKTSFHQIHKPSGSRIRYQKVAPGVGPVENEEIVKGYELEKGKYVLLSDEEIDKVRLEAKKVIDLVQFVDIAEIDPMYFDRPFFVVPDDDSDADAYVVLREALRKTKKAGLGQIVIRGKGSVVAIKACGRGLLLETLRYGGEVKNAQPAFKSVPDVKVEPDMLELAQELIARKSAPFDPDTFEDTYEAALHELIEAKAEHRKVRAIEEPPRGAKVIDLMEALRRSVGARGKSSGKSPRSRRGSGRGRSKRGAPSSRGSRKKAA